MDLLKQAKNDLDVLLSSSLSSADVILLTRRHAGFEPASGQTRMQISNLVYVESRTLENLDSLATLAVELNSELQPGVEAWRAANGVSSTSLHKGVPTVHARSSGAIELKKAGPMASRPKVFVASSREGLDIARAIQELLSSDASVVVWDQGTVFQLGNVTLESLERTVTEFQHGVFVFTPDDELTTRGHTHPAARDNVIFEMGMFVGKLGRHRAFAVHPIGMSLPSDLLGLTTAAYDPEEPNEAAALGPVVNKIRNALRLAQSE